MEELPELHPCYSALRLREVTPYYAILTALAAGHTTLQAIARQVGHDPRALSYYLQQLQELGYVERRYPLTGEPPSARSVHYDLTDPLLHFWFRFIFPSTSYIRHMRPDRALKDLIRPHLEPYLGLCFERLCREALSWLYLKEGVAAAFEVGQYWSKTTQIDIVGLRDDGWTDLGECKWDPCAPPSRRAGAGDEAAVIPQPRGATLGRRIFTRQKPKTAETSSGARWHGLDDLYT